MSIQYRTVARADHPMLLDFMRQLYEEDPAERPVPEEHFRRTLLELEQHPERGTILVMEKDRQIVGYAVLINFWSNECGGNVLTIDELFVAKPRRGQGLGADFVQHVITTKMNDFVALRLEVTPANSRARRLYERLGFSSYKNETLQLRLP
ncbi:MAG TPA: GNAT family N-acetyltransferase [Planctomycetaceae bacterium]|nr:GNAT family N-acetyltransferase [Planctomycetaceae bacterium]